MAPFYAKKATTESACVVDADDNHTVSRNTCYFDTSLRSLNTHLDHSTYGVC